MPSSNTPFWVTGDWERDPLKPFPTGISDHATLTAHEWTAVYAPKPNRVRAYFASKAQAQAVFDYMVGQNMEAHKSWLV